MAAGDGARTGIAAVIATAAAAAKPAEGEQLALLPAPSKFGEGTNRLRVVSEHVRRGDRGRPPGARNIATREMLEYVRHMIGDPVFERARWLRHTPASLAKELGCSELEAFDRLDAIKADLTKLFYAPLAAVDGQGNAVVPHFSLQIGGGTRPGAADRPPWEYLQETQQNQALLEQSETVSHGAVSHEDDK